MSKQVKTIVLLDQQRDGAQNQDSDLSNLFPCLRFLWMGWYRVQHDSALSLL